MSICRGSQPSSSLSPPFRTSSRSRHRCFPSQIEDLAKTLAPISVLNHVASSVARLSAIEEKLQQAEGAAAASDLAALVKQVARRDRAAQPVGRPSDVPGKFFLAGACKMGDCGLSLSSISPMTLCLSPM